MNRQMAEEIRRLDCDGRQLAPKLSAILAKGFLAKEGCTFLADCADGDISAFSVAAFHDRTGYECFVNHLHIDDYVDADYLVHGCLFAQQLLGKWREEGTSDIVIVIISANETGVTVRFHVRRAGESWVADDLEGYELDGVLVLDSTFEGRFPC